MPNSTRSGGSSAPTTFSRAAAETFVPPDFASSAGASRSGGWRTWTARTNLPPAALGRGGTAGACRGPATSIRPRSGDLPGSYPVPGTFVPGVVPGAAAEHMPPALAALRWHLGPSPERPTEPDEEEYAYPVLDPAPGSRLPGGDFASLRRQSRGFTAVGERHAWGLSSRTLWLDDMTGDLVTVLDLIAPHVAEAGYGGYVREGMDGTSPAPPRLSGHFPTGQGRTEGDAGAAYRCPAPRPERAVALSGRDPLAA
ncbi:hypothetical protein ABZ318_27565 [Streptomyces sp. NPDC006197]|uniref:hypothetical protein n=1 Tax=Streptomyces sp. NPDC006197 TaxID=3156685 RepID=UPI0033A98E33